MGDDVEKKKTKPNISKKEIKLGRFLLISGSIFAVVIFIGIVLVNLSNNRTESLRLQKEINELKYESSKQNALPTTTTPTTSPQVKQQPPTPQQVVVQDTDPVIDCKTSDCGTLKIKRSECSVGICCEIGDDWVWSKSEIECRNAQDDNYDRERAIEKEKNEAESLNEKTKLYYECLDSARARRDDCYKECSRIYEGDPIEILGCKNDLCEPDYSFAFDFCK